ncbi:SCP2 sterol-binding domain-containing protein 1-like [Hydractinia symbiolongicarpus]|uniref:SCP2 sterol-binding domain-containing protein 1-like n=1 Tax=Hydractinia symbiolongicarpus TaxID=13093 RepID=UPI00255145BB|nr:SCP2 sterol-binding domain-containing protein 1-like [Hydractinia symbiolongicarpus]
MASGLKADNVFSDLSKALSASPELVKNVKGKFLFQIMKDGVIAGEYYLDFSSSKPLISKSSTQKPDVTIKISDDDFILLAEQKLNSMKAFTQGKLKVSGKIMLAQKLGDVFKAYGKTTPSSPSPVPRPANADTLKATQAFRDIEAKVRSMPEVVGKVNGTFLFQITKSGRIAGEWLLDFSKSPAVIKKGPSSTKADVTIKVDDENFVQLALGKINPMQAFLQGKLKATGKVMLAQKLGDLFKSHTSKL